MSMAHPTTTGGAQRRLAAAGAERVRRWHVIGTCKPMQRRFGAESRGDRSGSLRHGGCAAAGHVST